MDWSKYLNPERLKKSTRNTQNDPRNEFESDFGRVVFSPAIRRMHDKTQVMPLTTNDNIHSRLTHSIEVMTIGYSLGIRLVVNPEFIRNSNLDSKNAFREIPMVLKSACLVHDIGNPPFGHFGEESIKSFFKEFFSKKLSNLDLKLSQEDKEDFIHFDGNAQGFRILTKLQVLDDAYGLNLTKATLASYLKYPNTGKIDEEKLNLKKRGVFQSEKDYLEIIAIDCGLKNKKEIIRHPLSFLVEAADSICYRVMDIEDGYNKAWYSYNDLKSYFDIPSLQNTFDTIEKEKESETNKVVSFRIALISILIELSIRNFITNHDKICTGEYNKELLQDDSNGLVKKLSDFCDEHLFPQREIQSLELTGDSVIKGLLTLYTNYIFNDNKQYMNKAIGLISKSIIKVAKLENKISLDGDFEELNDYFKLRIIVDFISGMTDQYALTHYQKLNGQKII